RRRSASSAAVKISSLSFSRGVSFMKAGVQENVIFIGAHATGGRAVHRSTALFCVRRVSLM
ncbi:hypothetical protein A8E46_09675, partial [Burkholderia cenocepacia]